MASSEPDRAATAEFEITPEMIDAGEQAILERVGGRDLGGYFSARQLAVEVYRAMRSMQRRVALDP